MAAILNADFEDWNFGINFNTPSDGTQLADNWFWKKGSANNQGINRNILSFSGTYALSIGNSGNTPSINTTDYVYQDITGYTDLLGLGITVTMEVFPFNSVSSPGHIFIDDGITVTSSPSTVVTGIYQLLSVSATISPFATRVRIGFMTDLYGAGFQNTIFDIATLSVGFTLNLSDFLATAEMIDKDETKVISENLALLAPLVKIPTRNFAESVGVVAPVTPTAVKNPQDIQVMGEVITISQILGPEAEVLMNEWVHIEILPTNKWTS